jgi:GNAT superfamily N-acetyltransferase
MTGVAVRALEPADIPECRRILYGLPDWFGLEESNRAYVESLSRFPAAVAEVDGAIVGFAALEEHDPNSVELHVIAVEQDRHRQGAGTALVDWAEEWCRDHGVRWFHVKTRGPATPDPGYERTRQFYLSMGFEPLFETLELWGRADAALIMVKRL